MIFNFLLLIILAYVVLIGYFILGFDKVEECNISNYKSDTKFSVIIPFRNEANILKNLLTTLLKIDYPKDNLEVIFVDDESTDASKHMIEDTLQQSSIDFKIINNKRLSNSPKKDAVREAIICSKYTWIVTTDADCYLQEKWLYELSTIIQEKSSKMIVAPVVFTSNGSFFEEFQYLDFLSLQASTIGGFGINKPFMCNGANLAYSKAIFQELNGFSNNQDIASGDDVFLLEKFVEHYPNDVHYLKSYNAVVSTKPETSLKALIQQRVRWAAKSSNYTNWFGKLVAFTVLLTNAALLDAIILACINWISWNHVFILYMLKFVVDFVLLYKGGKFFKKGFCIKYYIINAFLYSVFTIYVAFYAMLFKYKWKGRLYSK